jgi:hypothetical protein
MGKKSIKSFKIRLLNNNRIEKKINLNYTATAALGKSFKVEYHALRLKKLNPTIPEGLLTPNSKFLILLV